MPIVRAVVHEFFCGSVTVDTSVPPEQAVAIGAAVQGGILSALWPLPRGVLEDWDALMRVRAQRKRIR